MAGKSEGEERRMTADGAPGSLRTVSGVPIKPVYSAEDLKDFDPDSELGAPGEYPYTRGVYSEMYRKRPWTYRLYAGYGVGEDTNSRFKFLLANGQTGLSMALDLPTQLGLDSDDEKAYGEVGRVGVAIDSLLDMEKIFEGIPLDKISTSFTINSTANILLAMYLAVAEKQGVAQEKVRGTVQNDILKEYLARGTYIFPPRPSIRLIGDTIEYCLEHVPRFNAVNVAASHMRSAGATYIQATAYMMLDALEYIREVLERGYKIDDFAGNISFLSGANSDFYETIARLRASRRLWARIMKEKFEAQAPRSMMFRMATGGDCLTMTVEQPLINIARITLQALSDVLGGTQSMLLPAYDEAYAIPTEESARISLRIQQIIAGEAGITNVVDPFAGSYFIESLTNQVEKEIVAVMEKVEENGGMVTAIEKGTIQREMARQAREIQREIDQGIRPMVGHNCYRVEERIEEYEADMFTMDPAVYERQTERLEEVRSSRDQALTDEKLDALRRAAQGTSSTMPCLIDAVKAYATVGEITAVLKEVFGEYRQPTVF